MADLVQVVFRNQAGQPVDVQIFGYDAGGEQTQLTSGVVSEASGLFRVPGGYASYSCLASAKEMRTPLMRSDSRVTVVFTLEAGEQT
jgi:hypothetical protein